MGSAFGTVSATFARARQRGFLPIPPRVRLRFPSRPILPGREASCTKELSEVLQDWEAVIGTEIHTELTALDTKMFCNCKLSHDDEPNANVCPVCRACPAPLPVPNKRAIESIVKAGLATNCEIQRHSMFYRKHYFYPDMAKNFQTTQGPVAFAMYGHLTWT